MIAASMPEILCRVAIAGDAGFGWCGLGARAARSPARGRLSARDCSGDNGRRAIRNRHEEQQRPMATADQDLINDAAHDIAAREDGESCR